MAIYSFASKSLAVLAHLRIYSTPQKDKIFMSVLRITSSSTVTRCQQPMQRKKASAYVSLMLPLLQSLNVTVFIREGT